MDHLLFEKVSTGSYSSTHKEIANLLEEISEDIQRAKKVQKAIIPEKFPKIQGIDVKHRYMSGMKSGSEYLDFFQFENAPYVGVLMSDCSAYGLSSAFVSVIVKLALRLSLIHI